MMSNDIIDKEIRLSTLSANPQYFDKDGKLVGKYSKKIPNRKKSSNKYLRNFIESKSNPWELALNKSFKNTKPSPLEQIYIKAHTLSKRAYENSFSNPYSNILEVRAASGQKTKEFKFQGY